MQQVTQMGAFHRRTDRREAAQLYIGRGNWPKRNTPRYSRRRGAYGNGSGGTLRLWPQLLPRAIGPAATDGMMEV